MKQSNYDLILKCIQHGAPAMSDELITDFNQTVQLANERLVEMRRAIEAENVKKSAEAAKKAVEENTETEEQGE